MHIFLTYVNSAHPEHRSNVEIACIFCKLWDNYYITIKKGGVFSWQRKS